MTIRNPIITLCLLSALNIQAADVPTTINYQGRLVENGQLVNSNGMSVTLTLWDESTGGSSTYQEADSVDVVDGLYNTTLGDNKTGGSASSLLDALNTLGTNAWLGIKFGVDPELTPRERLMATPFALRLRGICVTDAGKVGIGTDNPTVGDLHVRGDATISQLVLAPDQSNSGGDSQITLAEDDDGTYCMNIKYDGDDNQLRIAGKSAGGWTEPHLAINRDDGRVGIGTNTPQELLHVAGAIVVGRADTPASVAGTIRWSGSDFEGHDGAQWVSLTKRTMFDAAGMCHIPAGLFQMGGTGVHVSPQSDETLHVVDVSAFRMMKYEIPKITWDVVRARAVASGYTFENDGDGDGPSHPVTGISWYDAVKWCNAYSEWFNLTPCYYTTAAKTNIYKQGMIAITNDCVKWDATGFRLPTEAEWEKAARGGLHGHAFPWPSSHAMSNAQINLLGNFYNSGDPYDNGYVSGTTPMGHYNGGQTPPGGDMANGYGLYDMAGNVTEWCWDLYASDYYGTADACRRDPKGPGLSGAFPLLQNRVIRGGCWQTPPLGLAYRGKFNPAGGAPPVGFRVVQSGSR